MHRNLHANFKLDNMSQGTELPSIYSIAITGSSMGLIAVRAKVSSVERSSVRAVRPVMRRYDGQPKAARCSSTALGHAGANVRNGQAPLTKR